MPCSFLDGPAGGQTLVLKRAPTYLRVVASAATLFGKFDGAKIDALDQPDDTPDPGEWVHVYEQVPGTRTVAFLCPRPGRIESAEYCHRPDVDGDQLRDTAAWRAWASAQQEAVHV